MWSENEDIHTYKKEIQLGIFASNIKNYDTFLWHCMHGWERVASSKSLILWKWINFIAAAPFLVKGGQEKVRKKEFMLKNLAMNILERKDGHTLFYIP